MPRDEDFYGEGQDGQGHDGGLEKRSEFVDDLPDPEPDAPTGDDGGSSGDGDGGDSGGDDGSGGADQ